MKTRLVTLIMLIGMGGHVNADSDAGLPKRLPFGALGRCMVRGVELAKRSLGKPQHFGWRVTRSKLDEMTPAQVLGRGGDLDLAARSLNEAEAVKIRDYLLEEDLFKEGTADLAFHFKDRFQGRGESIEMLPVFDLSKNSDRGLGILRRYDEANGTRHHLDVVSRYFTEDWDGGYHFTTKRLFDELLNSKHSDSVNQLVEGIFRSRRFPKHYTMDYHADSYTNWFGRRMKQALEQVSDGGKTPPDPEKLNQIAVRALFANLDNPRNSYTDREPFLEAITLTNALADYHRLQGRTGDSQVYGRVGEIFRTYDREGFVEEINQIVSRRTGERPAFVPQTYDTFRDALKEALDELIRLDPR